MAFPEKKHDETGGEDHVGHAKTKNGLTGTGTIPRPDLAKCIKDDATDILHQGCADGDGHIVNTYAAVAAYLQDASDELAGTYPQL